MKYILFNAIIVFFLTLSVVPCLAQQSGTVTFGYDANGNRRVRQINLSGRDVDMIKGDANPAIGERTPFFDSFEDLSIAIFPNPTKGKFLVVKHGGNGNTLIRAVLTTTDGI